MKVLVLEVKNWDKFNPRSDVKSTSWFRMSNSFFSDPDFYGQPVSVRLTWISILCEASKKMCSIVKINTLQISNSITTPELPLDPKSIEEAIYALTLIKNSENEPILVNHTVSNKITTIESDRIPQSNFPLQTDRHTNITNITNMFTDLGEPSVEAQAERVKVITLPTPEVKQQRSEAREILDHWNSLVEGKGHEGSKIQIEKISKAIKKLRKDFSLDEIKQGVGNYFTVLHGDEYFYSHHFTCWDFLTRQNNVNFMPGLYDPRSYLKTSPGRNGGPREAIQSTVTEEELVRAKQLGIL
jgi:hypothetical protein